MVARRAEKLLIQKIISNKESTEYLSYAVAMLMHFLNT
jgi:hypothetical protein